MREHAELLSSVRDDISEYKVTKLARTVSTDKYVSIISYSYKMHLCRHLGVCLQGHSYCVKELPYMEAYLMYDLMLV